MSKQSINPEKLAALAENLKVFEATVVNDLATISNKYLNLASKEAWLGIKSESFFESLNGYWGPTSQVSSDFVGPVPPSGAIIDAVHTEFENLINFINTAINKVTKTDEEVSENIEGSTKGDANNQPKTEKKENVTEPSTAAPVTNPSEPTTKAVEPTTKPNTENDKKLDAAPPKTESQEESSTSGSVPNASPSGNGASRNVSVGGFYPQESDYENISVAGLNYQIINKDGTPARANIGKETIKISGEDYQVYTYDDPETPEKEHYIIGALIEDGKRSKQTGKVYTMDFGNGDIYEFVDLDTNYSEKKGSEKTPGDAKYDTYVDMLSVSDHAFSNIDAEDGKPVKIADTGKTVSRK